MAINTNPGSPLRHVATFNSSGNWLAPVGTNLAFLSIHGASGGGAGFASRYAGQSSGGKGGDGVISGAWVQVTGGASHIVTIGAGGAVGTQSGNGEARSGNSGGTGGSTIFDGAITVTGGTGGTPGVRYSTGSAGNAGAGSGVTTLTTLNPGANTGIRTGTITTQGTGAASGGNGFIGTGSPNSATSGTSGTAGIIHIYI